MEEKLINANLKLVAAMVLKKDEGSYYGIDEWKKGWLEAFEHHLYGCPEKK
jgi:hypothetical protein